MQQATDASVLAFPQRFLPAVIKKSKPVHYTEQIIHSFFTDPHIYCAYFPWGRFWEDRANKFEDACSKLHSSPHKTHANYSMTTVHLIAFIVMNRNCF